MPAIIAYGYLAYNYRPSIVDGSYEHIIRQNPSDLLAIIVSIKLNWIQLIRESVPLESVCAAQINRTNALIVYAIHHGTHCYIDRNHGVGCIAYLWFVYMRLFVHIENRIENPQNLDIRLPLNCTTNHQNVVWFILQIESEYRFLRFQKLRQHDFTHILIYRIFFHPIQY